MEAIINDVFGRFWWVRYAKVRPVRTDYCDPARYGLAYHLEDTRSRPVL
jgi:hypothetical protein